MLQTQDTCLKRENFGILQNKLQTKVEVEVCQPTSDCTLISGMFWICRPSLYIYHFWIFRPSGEETQSDIYYRMIAKLDRGRQEEFDWFLPLDSVCLFRRINSFLIFLNPYHWIFFTHKRNRNGRT